MAAGTPNMKQQSQPKDQQVKSVGVTTREVSLSNIKAILDDPSSEPKTGAGIPPATRDPILEYPTFPESSTTGTKKLSKSKRGPKKKPKTAAEAIATEIVKVLPDDVPYTMVQRVFPSNSKSNIATQFVITSKVNPNDVRLVTLTKNEPQRAGTYSVKFKAADGKGHEKNEVVDIPNGMFVELSTLNSNKISAEVSNFFDKAVKAEMTVRDAPNLIPAPIQQKMVLPGPTDSASPNIVDQTRQGGGSIGGSLARIPEADVPYPPIGGANRNRDLGQPALVANIQAPLVAGPNLKIAELETGAKLASNSGLNSRAIDKPNAPGTLSLDDKERQISDAYDFLAVVRDLNQLGKTGESCVSNNGTTGELNDKKECISKGSANRMFQKEGVQYLECQQPGQTASIYPPGLMVQVKPDMDRLVECNRAARFQFKQDPKILANTVLNFQTPEFTALIDRKVAECKVNSGNPVCSSFFSVAGIMLDQCRKMQVSDPELGLACYIKDIPAYDSAIEKGASDYLAKPLAKLGPGADPSQAGLKEDLQDAPRRPSHRELMAVDAAIDLNDNDDEPKKSPFNWVASFFANPFLPAFGVAAAAMYFGTQSDRAWLDQRNKIFAPTPVNTAPPSYYNINNPTNNPGGTLNNWSPNATH